jgi:hypothetical protein
MRLASFALGGLLATVASAQNQYFVDDNGPANFNDLPSAVAAVSPGDVLIVRAGNYAGTVLSKGISILCDDGVRAPVLDITGVPAGQVAVVSGFQTEELAVTYCVGTVILQHVQVAVPSSNSAAGSPPALDVVQSADLRVYRSTFVAARDGNGSAFTPGANAVSVQGSRAEFVRCTLLGGGMGEVSSCAYDLAPGGIGLLVRGQSSVHVAGTSIEGGDGSDARWTCDNTWAGAGGAAIHVRENSSVVIAGSRGDIIRGGRPGQPSYYGEQGPNGSALVVDAGSTARYSGASLATYNSVWPNPMIYAPAGGATLAVPADPTLERIGGGQPGTQVVLRLRGPIGLLATLERGRQPVLFAGPGPIPMLVDALAQFALGAIPATGFVDKVVTISPSDPLGTRYLWQGSVSLAPFGGTFVRTNSVPVIVR